MLWRAYYYTFCFFSIVVRSRRHSDSSELYGQWFFPNNNLKQGNYL